MGLINRVPTCPVGVKAGRSPLLGDPIDKWRLVVLRWISLRTICSFNSWIAASRNAKLSCIQAVTFKQPRSQSCGLRNLGCHAASRLPQTNPQCGWIETAWFLLIVSYNILVTHTFAWLVVIYRLAWCLQCMSVVVAIPRYKCWNNWDMASSCVDTWL